MYSNGGANQVGFIDNKANFGGAIYIVDSGRATLLNTNITNPRATFGHGGAIYAANGGTSSSQLVMDRVGACPFGFSCSEIQDTTYELSIIFASNSLLEFHRTLIERSETFLSTQTYRIASVANGGIIRFNRVGILNNESKYITYTDQGGQIDLAHVTIAGNYFNSQGSTLYPWVTLNAGEVNIQNSIFSNTQGTDHRGGLRSYRCNLVDDQGDMPNGFYIGNALLNNIAGGDARQQAASLGVDMCNEDNFGWTGSNRDIEYQDSPVNEMTNQQGMPGDSGGLFDAGFDEVYDNIGNDEFLLTVLKAGSGSGSVISVPLGIACGSDCNEIYFNGTLIELNAIPDSGSVVSGWSGNCDLPGGNVCYETMTDHVTIT